jgi:hypothetical protein
MHDAVALIGEQGWTERRCNNNSEEEMPWWRALIQQERAHSRRLQPAVEADVL